MRLRPRLDRGDGLKDGHAAGDKVFDNLSEGEEQEVETSAHCSKSRAAFCSGNI